MEMRQGVYYLSVAAAGFLVFIIVLAIIKYIIFALVFIFTTGKLKLWIFPNLTEDVGFFESFWPVYVYTYDKPKKAKDSDDEESSEEEDEEEDEKGELLFDIQSLVRGGNLNYEFCWDAIFSSPGPGYHGLEPGEAASAEWRKFLLTLVRLG